MAYIVIIPACYGPNPEYLGPLAAGDEAGIDSGDSGESGDMSDDGNVSGTEDTSDTGNSSEAGDTGTTESAGDTGEAGDPSCADANPEPGELCFLASMLLAVPVQALVAGDFDSDAHLDLGVAAKDDLQVLFGDGSGGFPLQLDLPETDGDYFGGSAGDLDQDGHPDLLFTNFATDRVIVYASQGNKAFAAPVAFPTGDQPVASSLALIDGNDLLDVVVVDKGSDTVSVLINQGMGLLDLPSSDSTNGDEPRHLVIGSFDPGPALDLAVANRNGETVSILIGSGQGSFGAAQVQPLEGKPHGLVAGDFDLDGILDLAVALADDDSVEILFGDGFGEFGAKQVEIPVGDRPVAIAIVDLDIDGALDLVVLNRDDANVGVLFGDTKQPGEFLAQQNLVGLGNFSGLTSILVADLNSDGVDDLVVGGDELRTLISNP